MSGVVVADPVNDLIDALSGGLVLNEDGVYMGEDAGILIREALATAEHNARPRWIHSTVERPKVGQHICCFRGERGHGAEVGEDGRVYLWHSVYPVGDEFYWCELIPPPEGPTDV